MWNAVRQIYKLAYILPAISVCVVLEAYISWGRGGGGGDLGCQSGLKFVVHSHREYKVSLREDCRCWWHLLFSVSQIGLFAVGSQLLSHAGNCDAAYSDNYIPQTRHKLQPSAATHHLLQSAHKVNTKCTKNYLHHKNLQGLCVPHKTPFDLCRGISCYQVVTNVIQTERVDRSAETALGKPTCRIENAAS